MNIAKAKEHIKRTVRAYLERDESGMHVISPVNQRPVFLMGAPGIGKTAIIEQIARELDLGVVSYSMTHHTRQSALGLPHIVHHAFEDFEYDASEYTMSEIVSAIYDRMEETGERRGILFLDEINCVSETLYPSMLQFLQFKTFGRHRVPEDWVIVCAGNPPEYNRSAHDFDIVTLDRLRELDVEPEYSAWKVYASERGLHPAVTTFLETKPDCFYKVERKAGGGKSFVTARGWEDLARLISLYEGMGEPCDDELFGQFLRDEEIAEKFAAYYELFEKYRSDYQVPRVLDGTVPDGVVDRAKAAAFDERIALLGLLLDAINHDCTAPIVDSDVVMDVRNVIRDAKEPLVSGGSVEDVIMSQCRLRKETLARKIANRTVLPGWQRREGAVVKMLESFVHSCEAAGDTSGEAALAHLSELYAEKAQGVKAGAADVKERMGNAFRFVEDAFGDGREMVMFVAELSTREATTQFISRFGCDAYYAHNSNLQVDEARSALAQDVQSVQEHEEFLRRAEVGEHNALDLGSDAGIKNA